MKDTLRVLLWIMMTCFWSCSSGDEEISEPTPKPESNKVEISGSVPVVEQKGSTATVTFTTNAAWTASVSSSTSWVTVSPTSGNAGTHTLTITTTENDTYDERNATVTIKAGNASKNITVTQKQKDALIVTSNKVEIGCVGGEFTIEAKANVSLTYEIEESAKEWITAGESRALSTSTLKFNAKTNEKEEARQGNIVLKGGDGLTETVTVYQEGEKPTLVITSNDVIVGSDGETIKIELKSNVDYTMVLPNVDWISQAESRAISAYTHYLTIAPNESYDQRSAMIYVNNETEDLKDSISITQLQKDAIIVAKNEYEVAPEGGQLEFKVSSNVEFQISTSANWIKQDTGSRGLVEKALSFTIEENEAKESRSGEIIVTYGELKQTIRIIQHSLESIERAALIEFYQATGGDNWTNKTNWCSDEPVNEWYGITRTGDYITEINLDSNNLTGSIPECIGNLSKLKVLKMPSNQLTGSIPESIGNLTDLRDLVLRENQFSGSIPDSIWNLTKLESLDLEWNQLTGSIPESIGNLTKLKYLKLGQNQLTGSIPESIGNLTDLRDLVLRENQFSGSIPESIGKLSKMKYIDFTRNQFTGSIPECIGNLTQLFALYLGYNQFTGNIPASIGKLTELWSLMLRDNQLTGSIPESIGNLGNLEVINFMNNSLSGKIPESVTKLEAWKYYWHIVIQGNPELDLEGVYIPGPVFSITDIDGNQIVSKTEYEKNKLTILYCWGTWCPASNAFNPTLVQLYNAYHKYGMEIIGSCVPKKDSIEETMSYLEKKTIPWRNAIESEGNMINIFNIDIYLPCVIAVNDNKEVIFQSFTEDYCLLTDVVHKYFESTTDE